MRRKLPFFLVLLTLFTFSACDTKDKEGYYQGSKKTEGYVNEVGYAHEWMQELYFHIKTEIITPPPAARIYAYVCIAIYESVVHGMPENRSLAGQLNGLDKLPEPEKGKEYDWATVMCETVFHVSDEMLSRYMLTGNDHSLTDLHDKQMKERKAALEGQKGVFENSVAYGIELSKSLNAWAATDNYDSTRFKFYKTPGRLDHPEYWEACEFSQLPVEPFWGTLRPMAIKDMNTVAIKMSVPFSTDTASQFYKEALTTLQEDLNLTEEKRDIALWWADCPGETGTPGGHWMFVVNRIIRDSKYDLGKAAELYAMVGIGMNDAFISCWKTKYEVNLVRPKTYIRENVAGYETWEPLIVTPPFPEYASGHSVVSGCCSEIMMDMVGENVGFVDSTHVRIGLKPRTYSSFRAMAEEVANSRIYGGMHYPVAVKDGLKQGRLVHDQIMKNVHLKKDQQP